MLHLMMKGQPLSPSAVSRDELFEDDVATEEDLRDIAQARSEYKSGETVCHGDID